MAGVDEIRERKKLDLSAVPDGSIDPTLREQLEEMDLSVGDTHEIIRSLVSRVKALEEGAP